MQFEKLVCRFNSYDQNEMCREFKASRVNEFLLYTHVGPLARWRSHIRSQADYIARVEVSRCLRAPDGLLCMAFKSPAGAKVFRRPRGAGLGRCRVSTGGRGGGLVLKLDTLLTQHLWGRSGPTSVGLTERWVSERSQGPLPVPRSQPDQIF